MGPIPDQAVIPASWAFGRNEGLTPAGSVAAPPSARLIVDCSAPGPPSSTGERERRQGHADDVNKYRDICSFRRHLAFEDLDHVTEVIAFNRGVHQGHDELLQLVAFKQRHIGIGRVGQEAVFAVTPERNELRRPHMRGDTLWPIGKHDGDRAHVLERQLLRSLVEGHCVGGLNEQEVSLLRAGGECSAPWVFAAPLLDVSAVKRTFETENVRQALCSGFAFPAEFLSQPLARFQRDGIDGDAATDTRLRPPLLPMILLVRSSKSSQP
jgi:hypothetical protein